MIPIVTLLFLLIDWYVWQAVRVSFQNTSQTVQTTVRYVFWGLTVLTLTGMWLYNFTNPDWLGKTLRTWIMVGVFMNYFSKLVVILFLLIDDLGRLVRWVVAKVQEWQGKGNVAPNTTETPISRSEFLMKTAVVAGSIPAVAMTWGILSGAHDYRIRKVKLALKNLPKAFEGLTIAQVSDIHSGSFFNKVAVKGGIDMLLNQKPDVVFFTGDLVNNEAREVKDYIDLFGKIKAPLGVYSTLGNHDYGDYLKWESPQAKKQNLADLKKAHQLMGWDLLNDEHHFLEQNGEKLAIIGVQNISGAARFHTYGDLAKAVKGTDEAAVKLLLSHDPTHWDKEVNTQ